MNTMECEPTVVQVSKYYYPAVGGIERVVRQLSEGLGTHGYQSRVLAVGQQRLGNEQIDGIPVKRVRSLGSLLSTPLSPTFPFSLRKELARADIAHYHLPNPLAVTSGLLQRHSVPTVVTYHSDIVRQKGAFRLYAPVLHRFLDGVDRILATSPRLLEHSPVLDRYRSKCEVVPLGIDREAYGTYDGTVPPELRDLEGTTFLFVGRLNYYKGVEYLIEAFARADLDGNLLVVGDGPRRAAVERLARECGVIDQVRFLGEVIDGTLHCCYALSDVFVLPSVAPSEAFGIVQLEAMAYGTPVINTRLPTGVPWVSLDGETGLTVPPKDSDALAKALRRLGQDPQLRAQLGMAARERVEKQFTETRMVSSVAAIYDSLA